MNENAKHNVSLGTLYDFNKQLILQQGKITKFQLETKKAESKNSDLPYTGYAVKGIGILLAVIIFSIFSCKKYFKYKNI